VTDAISNPPQVRRPRIATTWLDGCSGCHMSLLDLDERILTITAQCDIVYSPLVDTKVVPEGIDLALIEGAVSSDHDWYLAKELRARSAFVIAFGDCAVTGNVPSMRNGIPVASLFRQVYDRPESSGPKRPSEHLPKLLERALPLHEVIAVDLFLQGCPPNPEAILHVLSELLAGRNPDPTRFTHLGA
jgi:NAD-reducing hydrogenase small subunit